MFFFLTTGINFEDKWAHRSKRIPFGNESDSLRADFSTEFDPFRAVWDRNIKTVEYNSLFNGTPFSFCNMSQSASFLERYVYNMGGYLVVRFAVEIEKQSIYSTLVERVTNEFKDLCGQESEEYRRSIWYLTTYLEEQRAWANVQKYLEPLVVQSMNKPTLVWSHERCIIRLIHAYFELGLSSEAQQLSKRVQKAYDSARKVLRSMQKDRLPAEYKALQVFGRPYLAPFHKLLQDCGRKSRMHHPGRYSSEP